MTPRVSVIIPANNAAGSLVETLDSIVAQTYGSWEAIVADDASTDATQEIASGYHPQVKCVRSAHRLGIGGARNLALSEAKGELVALLDADDLWMPEYLAHQLERYDEAVAAGESVGVVCCDAFEFGPGGLRPDTYSRRVGWADPVTIKTLLRSNTIFISAVVPRDLIEALGGFATDCLGTEDYDLWLRIVESGRTVVAVREPLVLYRISDTAISASVATMARATQTTYRRALQRGQLDLIESAIARRQLRLQRFVELWEEAARRRVQTGRFPWGMVVRATPLGVRVILERPARWRHWSRLGVGILRGAPAAGVDRSRAG